MTSRALTRGVALAVLSLLSMALLSRGAAVAQEANPALPLTVRVTLASLGAPRRLALRPTGDARLTETAGGEALNAGAGPISLEAAGDQVVLGDRKAAGFRVEAESVRLEAGAVRRSYPGALLISASRGRLRIVNECPLEPYTEGVLAGECPAAFHPEAIRAMAIAARSYSYRKAFISAGELCDTTHCHLYRGTENVKPAIRQAVQATAGRVALYGDEVIDAVYSSDCGGYTEANEDAWKGAKPIPYLRPVPDAPEPGGTPFCAANRAHAWTLALNQSRLQSLYGKSAPPVRLEVLEHTSSGRVRLLRLLPAAEAGTGSGEEAKPRVFTGEQWRQLLGPQAVRSLHFQLRETGSGVVLEGAGWGHGVGLCQFGANGMAREGATAEAILRHYYSGIEIGPAPAPPQARTRPARRPRMARSSR